MSVSDSFLVVDVGNYVLHQEFCFDAMRLPTSTHLQHVFAKHILPILLGDNVGANDTPNLLCNHTVRPNHEHHHSTRINSVCGPFSSGAQGGAPAYNVFIDALGSVNSAFFQNMTSFMGTVAFSGPLFTVLG